APAICGRLPGPKMMSTTISRPMIHQWLMKPGISRLSSQKSAKATGRDRRPLLDRDDDAQDSIARLDLADQRGAAQDGAEVVEDDHSWARGRPVGLQDEALAAVDALPGDARPAHPRR